MKVKPSMIGVPLGILIYLGIVAYPKYAEMQLTRSRELQQQAWSKLHTGMSIVEASGIVEELAWRRFTCHYDAWQRDVYLFGSHDVDLSSMLILEYRRANNEVTLVSIGAFEMYMLNPVTRGCTVEDIH